MLEKEGCFICERSNILNHNEHAPNLVRLNEPSFAEVREDYTLQLKMICQQSIWHRYRPASRRMLLSA